MESPHGLLLMAIIIANSAIIHLVQAQDQKDANTSSYIFEIVGLNYVESHNLTGTIYLNRVHQFGLRVTPNETSPYIHPESGLKFSSDSDFIQSGQIGRIEKSQEEMFPMMLTTLRYFPDGKRNCYTLNVKQDTNYLIRARFIYGNYDGRNIYPKFDLHIGPNLWTSMDLEKTEGVRNAANSISLDEGGDTFEEIMHTPKSGFLDVCLVKTDSSTPFISSLELRPLPNDTYITSSSSWMSWGRYYRSDNINTKLMFPDDAYDRVWYPYLFSDLKISTNLKANNSGSFFLPQDVITAAAVPGKASKRMATSTSFSSSDYQFFYFLHFSEVQVLGANETREFDILWNGEVIHYDFRPAYMQPKTVSNQYPVTCERRECILELNKTQKSTLPPLLNAIELYVEIDFPQSQTNENDVLAIRNIKATYGLKKVTWQGDPCVPKLFSWDGLICYIVDKSTGPIITSLDLSSSGLTGTIADGIQNLTYLEKLDLSNNSLVGAVPKFLANMKSLSFINLSKNNLNGSIPQALRNREKRGLKIFFDGDEEKPSISGSLAPKKKFPVLIIIAVVALVVVIVVIVLVLIFVSKRKKASNHVEDNTDTSIETKRRKFSYLQIMKMTKNLERPLGEGGFGVVYYGEVNSSPVAVKLLSKSSAQGYKEFKAEIELLLRVHHINLVSLVGYCDERDHLALIYEYMPNRDLKHHLSGKDGASILSWSTRLQIAIGSALGMEYLHNACQPPMVHRDIKCTNILLDEHFIAKIADFGLSRSESHVSTVVAGTPGYLDPEYYRTGRLAEMSDVYSFGVVLLEITTNQSVIDQTREKPHITDWTASMLNRGDITKIMDPNLNGDYNSRSVWRALELAMLCTNSLYENRPSMSKVVAELKECLISENRMGNNHQDKDSQSSLEVSMSVDTNALPSAR